MWLRIDAAMEKINEAWKNASEEMYKAQQEAGGAEGQPTDGAAQGGEGGATADDVTDVEYEEVDDDKK